MSFDKSASRRQFLYDFKFTSIKQAYWSDVSLGGRWESLKLMRNKLCDKLGSSLSEQVAVENLLNGTLLYLPELFLLISDLTGCQSELLTTAEFSLQSILMTSDDFQTVGLLRNWHSFCLSLECVTANWRRCVNSEVKIS
eukprot:362213_1